MDWVVFPKGVLLGFSIAAPVGPIGLLTIRRTLSNGFRMGFATGLGAATADTIYGLIAAFGLTAIMTALTDRADAIRLIGGCMLLVIGIRGIRAELRPHAEATAAQVEAVRSAWASYAQTIGLTLTNPLTILSFVAMFAGVGISDEGGSVVGAIALVAGVAAGSSAWWLLLASIVSRIRHRLSKRSIRLINLGSNVIITGFGVVAFAATVL